MYPSCLRKWNRTHIKNQPAKLPLDGDHIHAAFPSSSLRHVPVSFLCPLLPTSLSPSLLSIWSLSLPTFHQDSLCSARLQALLSSLSLIGRIVSGLVVYSYLLLDVSLGHCCPGAFQQPVQLLESMWLSPLRCSCHRAVPERWRHREACRAISPRWFPQVSLPLAFYFQHIYMASFLSTVLTFRISLMPASLLLFGTLSPIEWPLWQYSKGPSCSFLKRLGTLESCPRLPCSMGFASVFCTLEDSSYFQTERQVLWKCLTHLSPKELEELDCPQCLNVLHKIPNEFYTWQILMLAAV